MYNIPYRPSPHIEPSSMCSSIILVILSFRNNRVFQYDRLITCALGTIFSVNWSQILRAALISQMPCGRSLNIIASVTL